MKIKVNYSISLSRMEPVGIFMGICMSETSGRNMTVELDSRHPLLPKTGWGKMKI
jgi:hypothetical protein